MTPAHQNSEKRRLLALIVCLQILVFFCDILTPNGLADWIWNFLPLILSVWYGGQWFTIGLAIVASASTLVAYNLAYRWSPASNIDPLLAFASRLAGIGFFWICVLLVNFIKQTKNHLRRLEHALRMISECNQIIVRATEETELLRTVCNTIVITGGYRMSFVGFAENDARKSIRIAAHAGCEEGYLEKAQICWSDQDPHGLGPTGLAIRHGETITCNDFLHDERTALWRVAAHQRGYYSSITIPLVNDRKNFGVLVLYGSRPNIFSTEEIGLLNKLADDLAFGVQNLRTRLAQQAGELELANTKEHLETLVAAMPDAVFFKDGQGRWLIVNEVAKQLFQLAKSPWQGRTDAEMANDLPDLQAAHEACLVSDEQAWQAGRLTVGEEQIALPDGRRLIAEVFKQPLFHPDGRRKSLIAIGRDITARKKMELEMVRARDFYLNLLENAPALVWRAGTDAKCDWFNAGWLKFTGRKMEQEIGDGWADGVHPEDLKRCVEYYLEAFRQRQAFEMEYRLRRHDGEYRWIIDHGVPFQNLDGGFGGYVGYCFDITQRKQVQQALIESQENLLTLINSLPDNVILKDAGGRWLVANPPALKFFRLGPLDWQGRTDAELAETNPALKGLHTACMRSDETGWAAKGITQVVERGPGLDGRLEEHEVTKVPLFQADGSRKALLVIGRDVTEKSRLTKSLELSELMASQSRDMLMLVRKSDGRICSVNAAATETYGYSHEELLTMTVYDLRKEADDASQIASNLSAAFAHGILFETVHRRKDGTLMPVEVSSQGFTHGGEHYLVSAIRDISERKRIQSQLESQRRFIADLVEYSPIAAFVKDRNGRYLMSNRAFEVLIGRKREEIIGHSDVDFFSGKPSAQFHENDFKIMVTGTSQVFEEFLADEDGQQRTFLTTKFPVRNEQGEITGVCGKAMEITQIKKTEIALRKSEERFRMLLATLPIPLAVFDRQEAVTFVNLKFTETFGYRREDLPTVAAWWQKAYPDPVYRQKVIDLWTAYSDQIVQGAKDPAATEARVTCKDDSCREIRFSLTLAGDQNLVIFDDVTLRKRAEDEIKRLATVVEQATEAILVTNLAGEIIYVNPAFATVTGYPREEVIGKNPRFLKSGRQNANFYHEMWKTLKRGEVWRGHFTNRRKDGKLYEEDAVISPIRDRAGNVVSYVASLHDVTRELQLEAQFRQAQKMEAIGTLAGGIAHDFNNILMAIFAYGGMLKNDLAKHPKLRQMADQILKSADRAKDLVQQILTLSRQEEHKREIIRLEPVIKEAVKFLRASLPVDIKIELSLSPDAPTVLADSTQIYQVVMNLVTNAFHAMEGKPGRLSIVLDRFTPDRALLESNPKFHPICYARLTATDTGHGMDAKTIERIFEPFFTTKGVGKGTGLGLAVVHGVAQSHDAVITVASELEKGTSFSLYFPEQKLEADLASHSICDLPMGNGQRILVVDDEGTLAAMFERLLHLLHYRPIVCTNPLEALKLFKNNPSQFDMVVTDHAMPEMSGLELAREIRTIHENVPLVVISGFIGSEIQEKYHEAGIREMIRKPAAITDVAQILHRNLIC